MLLEFLQKKFRTTIFIKADFENIGSDDNPQWVAKNPKIFDMSNNTEIIKLKKDLFSEEYRSKKDAEKDLYLQILNYLKNNEFSEKI